MFELKIALIQLMDRNKQTANNALRMTGPHREVYQVDIPW